MSSARKEEKKNESTTPELPESFNASLVIFDKSQPMFTVRKFLPLYNKTIIISGVHIRNKSVLSYFVSCLGGKERDIRYYWVFLLLFIQSFVMLFFIGSLLSCDITRNVQTSLHEKLSQE